MSAAATSQNPSELRICWKNSLSVLLLLWRGIYEFVTSEKLPLRDFFAMKKLTSVVAFVTV